MIFRVLIASLLVAALAAPMAGAQRHDLPDADTQRPDLPDLPDSDARPIRPPIPVFPRNAARFGLSGYCEVRFNIDTWGRTSHVRPLCSHAEFCASAATAMEEVRFMPARRNGKIVPRRNVVYPLEYTFEGAPPLERDLTNLVDCVDPYIF